MSKECLWPPQGSGTQHKSLRCSRLCILFSCLPFLEERGKPESAPSLSVSQTAVSVATEADTWAASALPCRTTVEGLQSPCLLGEVAGESWEEEVGSFKQKGIHGAQLQGGLPTRMCTCRRPSLTKWPSASSAIFKATMEMGYDQSFHRCFKATALGPIPKVGQPSCAVQLGGHNEGRGKCRRTGCFENKECPQRELRRRQTD